MLDLMRKKKQSIIIKVVFIIIVLSFIGTMFLVWGKGDEGGGRSSGYAAKVDGTKISLEDYQSAYQQLRNVYQQIYGQTIPSDMEKVLGIRKMALEGLIDRVLILKEARNLGVKVSKEDVANDIAAMPAFQKNGAFSFELYNQLLKSNRITPKDFEAGQKDELIVKKAKEVIRERAKVTDEDALAEYKKLNDRIDLSYVSFAPADVVGEVKLTEADLNDYLQKNQNQFKTPEQVAVSYIVIDPSAQAGTLTVSEEEIQTFYQKNIDRWQGKDGILPLKDVKDKVKAQALRQKAAKQTYELAADTLYKNIKSGDLGQIAGQLHAKVQKTGLFAASNPPQALAGEAAVVKKAFELKQGELGGPVETAKGIYIIKADDRKASVVPPLAQIRGAVEQKAKAAGAVELAKKKADDAAAQMAAKPPATMKSTGLFGYSAKGEVPTVGVSPDLVEAAFKLTTAAPAPATPFKVGERWYAVRLKQRVEAPRAEFDKTKEQIKQKMLPKKQEEALNTWLKDLRAKSKIEKNEALVAER